MFKYSLYGTNPQTFSGMGKSSISLFSDPQVVSAPVWKDIYGIEYRGKGFSGNRCLLIKISSP